MNSCAVTDVGKQREMNQDYIFCSETPVGMLPNLFLVADGMGGHNAGDFASRFCVEEFTKLVANSKERTIISQIETALIETGKRLIEQGRLHPEMEGMGTTFVLAVVDGTILYIANIGDSRLYVVKEKIKQITEDHSLVAEMVRNREIKKEEARFHPNKNVVTRALSTNSLVKPDFFEYIIKPGELILLCSDGLTTMIDDDEILSIIKRSESVENAASSLIAKANENGGKDNISVVLVKV